MSDTFILCAMIGEPLHIRDGFWRENRLASGRSLDALFGQNIPSNAKTIDRTVGTHRIVSHKSTDLRLKSYRNPGRVYRLGMSFVQSLIDYQGEVRRDRKLKATYHLYWATEHPECERVLAWFVPQFVGEDHETAIARVVRDARRRAVEVVVYRVAD